MRVNFKNFPFTGSIMVEEKLIEILENAKKRKNLWMDRRSVENVLIALKKTSNFWDIVRYSREHLRGVVSILEAMKDLGYVIFEGKEIKLTPAGKELVEAMGLDAEFSYCKTCRGKGLQLNEKALEEFKEITKHRPKAIHEFDQGYIYPEISILRAQFMHLNGDVSGRRIFIIGDDDLMAIALNLVARPKEVVAIDIDSRIVEFLKKAAEEYDFRITPMVLDLRKPLPEEMLQAFDVFETDPTESLKGVKAFIGRGIAAVRDGGAGYFGITRVESSRWKWLQLEKFLLEKGCVITDILQGFHEYVDWDYYKDTPAYIENPVKSEPTPRWYTSALIRIEILKGKRDNEPFEEEVLYQDEEAATV